MPFRSFGPLELILILVLVMLVFGVGKLPEIGKMMGKAVKEFRGSTDDNKEDLGASVKDKKEQLEESNYLIFLSKPIWTSKY